MPNKIRDAKNPTEKPVTIFIIKSPKNIPATNPITAEKIPK